VLVLIGLAAFPAMPNGRGTFGDTAAGKPELIFGPCVPVGQSSTPLILRRMIGSWRPLPNNLILGEHASSQNQCCLLGRFMLLNLR
jgi:hypothetical protein